MSLPASPYLNEHRAITVAFDVDDPQQAELFRGLRRSLGEKYAQPENVMASRCVLHVYPGGAREVSK